MWLLHQALRAFGGASEYPSMRHVATEPGRYCATARRNEAPTGAGASRSPARKGRGGQSLRVSVASTAMTSADANASINVSGTLLVRKLGIKPGARLGLIGAPDGFDETLGELPPDVAVRRRARGPLDVIVAFHTSRASLEHSLPRLMGALDPAGGLWIAWPKRASGVATDVTENLVREFGLAVGLVDNKVCAIDEVWSGLRLVYRLVDRPR
jgi:hypothetical protein